MKAPNVQGTALGAARCKFRLVSLGEFSPFVLLLIYLLLWAEGLIKWINQRLEESKVLPCLPIQLATDFLFPAPQHNGSCVKRHGRGVRGLLMRYKYRGTKRSAYGFFSMGLDGLLDKCYILFLWNMWQYFSADLICSCVDFHKNCTHWAPFYPSHKRKRHGFTFTIVLCLR